MDLYRLFLLEGVYIACFLWITFLDYVRCSFCIRRVRISQASLLRPTANGSAPFSGRDRERDQIVSFIKPFLDAPTDPKTEVSGHAILYISGTPGTGKTALVTAILRDMSKDIEHAKVNTIVVNCMALNNLDALWDRLVDELKDKHAKSAGGGKRKKTKEAPLELLERLFSRNLGKW